MRIYNRLCFFMILSGALFFSSLASASVEVGDTMPALKVPEFGKTLFDTSQLKGKVIVIHFWATWCGPCRVETPILEAFNNKYQGKGVEVIAVSVDTARHKNDVIAAMKGLKLPVAMISDASQNDFGMPSLIPIIYIIDTKGVVVAKLLPDVAPLSDDSLAALIDPLLPQTSLPKAPLLRSL